MVSYEGAREAGCAMRPHARRQTLPATRAQFWQPHFMAMEPILVDALDFKDLIGG